MGEEGLQHRPKDRVFRRQESHQLFDSRKGYEGGRGKFPMHRRQRYRWRVEARDDARCEVQTGDGHFSKPDKVCVERRTSGSAHVQV